MKKTILFTIVVVLISTAGSSYAVIYNVPKYNDITEHWYEAIPGQLDWFGAAADAGTHYHQGMKGHLATFASYEEKCSCLVISERNRACG